MNKFSHKFCTKIALGMFAERLEKFSNPKIFIQIEQGSILPDFDENFQGYACHFFNPVTNSNFLGSENHAKSRCIGHLAKFILNKNWLELGRAIHFLEDVCTPVHTQYEDSADAAIRLPIHLEFEHEFDKFLQTKKFDYIPLKKSGNIENLIDTAALKSAELYHEYKNLKNKTFQAMKIFEKVLKSAVNSVCTLIKFVLKDGHIAQEIRCNSELIGYNLDNGILSVMVDNYRIRRLSSGKFAIFKKPGIGKNFVFLEKRVGTN